MISLTFFCYNLERKKERTNHVIYSLPHRKRKKKTAGLLEKERKKERKKEKMRCLWFFMVFLKSWKKRNESKNERKIEEIEWFVVFQRRRRHQKKVKKKKDESFHIMILKVMKTIISISFKLIIFLRGEKYFPNWKMFSLERNFIIFHLV